MFFDRIRKKTTVVYFSPHQDDELLTLGVDASKRLARRKDDTHIFLIVDGSRSSVRGVLANGKGCAKHEGIHQYELSVPEFIAARDREFAGSCRALGYPDDAVHIIEDRIVDGTLTEEKAESAMRKALDRFTGDVEVRTISPFGGEKQHSDHRALGLAAIRLYNEGKIKRLILFVEPYCVEGSRKTHPELRLRESRANKDDKDRIRRAIAEYSLWKPDEGRYAIGYHSVTREFDDFMADTKAHYHIPVKG